MTRIKVTELEWDENFSLLSQKAEIGEILYCYCARRRQKGKETFV